MKLLFEEFRRITNDDYDKKNQELKNKQFKNNETMKNYLKADQNFKITVNTLLSSASKAYELFECSSIEQKRAFIDNVFSDLELEGTKLRYSLDYIKKFCGCKLRVNSIKKGSAPYHYSALFVIYIKL